MLSQNDNSISVHFQEPILLRLVDFCSDISLESSYVSIPEIIQVEEIEPIANELNKKTRIRLLIEGVKQGDNDNARYQEITRKARNKFKFAD